MAEEVVAEVELDFARNADQYPALRVEEDTFNHRDSNQFAGEQQNATSGDSLTHCINGPLENLGKKHPDSVGRDAGKAAPQVSPAVASHVNEEGPQFAKHASIVRGGASLF